VEGTCCGGFSSFRPQPRTARCRNAVRPASWSHGSGSCHGADSWFPACTRSRSHLAAFQQRKAQRAKHQNYMPWAQVHGMPTWAAHTLTSNTSFVSIAGKGSAHDRRLARSVRSVCGRRYASSQYPKATRCEAGTPCDVRSQLRPVNCGLGNHLRHADPDTASAITL